MGVNRDRIETVRSALAAGRRRRGRLTSASQVRNRTASRRLRPGGSVRARTRERSPGRSLREPAGNGVLRTASPSGVLSRPWITIASEPWARALSIRSRGVRAASLRAPCRSIRSSGSGSPRRRAKGWASLTPPAAALRSAFRASETAARRHPRIACSGSTASPASRRGRARGRSASLRPRRDRRSRRLRRRGRSLRSFPRRPGQSLVGDAQQRHRLPHRARVGELEGRLRGDPFVGGIAASAHAPARREARSKDVEGEASMREEMLDRTDSAPRISSPTRSRRTCGKRSFASLDRSLRRGAPRPAIRPSSGRRTTRIRPSPRARPRPRASSSASSSSA